MVGSARHSKKKDFLRPLSKVNRLWFDKYHLTTNLVIEEIDQEGEKKKKVEGRKEGGQSERENAEEGRKEAENQRSRQNQKRPVRAATTRNQKNGVRVRIKCPQPGAGTRLEVRPRFDPR